MEILNIYIKFANKLSISSGCCSCDTTARFISYLLHNKHHLMEIPTQRQVYDLIYNITYSNDGRIGSYITESRPWCRHEIRLEAITGLFSHDFSIQIMNKINFYIKKFGYVYINK